MSISNYHKYYNINSRRANPNGCILMIPKTQDTTYYSNSMGDFKNSVFTYFAQHVYDSERELTNKNFLFDYMTALINGVDFDFDNFSYLACSAIVGGAETAKEVYPFKEIEISHNSCATNIYSERIYTNFVSHVLNNSGVPVSLIATMLNHPEFVAGLKFNEDSGTLYRLEYMQKNDLDKFSKFTTALEHKEAVSDENKQKVYHAFEAFTNRISNQKIYTNDELIVSSRYKNSTSILFSLFLEFFIYIEDKEHIFKLFEVFHKVGNVKAKTFNMYLKNKDEITNTEERPIAKYVARNNGVINNRLNEFYYFISFYKQYDGGKYFSKIVDDELLQSYVLAFKSVIANKQPVKREYYNLFNEIKGDDVYRLEVFEQLNNLVTAKLSGSAALDVLEQNFALLELCFNNDVYGSRWSSTIYNLFTHIGYDNLSEPQKTRYWKMVGNFVNNTKMKSARVKKILTNIVNLLNINVGELMTFLQPHVLAAKQTVLLEMYLE